MSELSKRDQERLDKIVAWEWDMGGWTQYRDAEPMVGAVEVGAVEHAFLESHDPNNPNSWLTWHVLCGRRFDRFQVATARAFDADMPRVGKPCAVCLRLIGPFREWQAARLTPTPSPDTGETRA